MAVTGKKEPDVAQAVPQDVPQDVPEEIIPATVPAMKGVWLYFCIGQTTAGPRLCSIDSRDGKWQIANSRELEELMVTTCGVPQTVLNQLKNIRG